MLGWSPREVKSLLTSALEGESGALGPSQFSVFLRLVHAQTPAQGWRDGRVVAAGGQFAGSFFQPFSPYYTLDPRTYSSYNSKFLPFD